MSFIRSLFGTAKIVAYFAFYGVKLVLTRPRQRASRAEWLHGFCAAIARGMNLKISVEGTFPEQGAVISNHLGYADIIVYAATHRCVFCSKAEIRKWPVLGWMTTMAGSVYVERGRGGSALKAGGAMVEAEQAGLPVVFFPEGTTSNGERVLPFHSGLLAMAMGSGLPVTAAHISYTLDEPNPPGTVLADDVHYWGDINLLKHIFRFAGLRGVHAHVRFAPAPIPFSTDKLHRKTAAVEAREAVLALQSAVTPAS